MHFFLKQGIFRKFNQPLESKFLLKMPSQLSGRLLSQES